MAESLKMIPFLREIIKFNALLLLLSETIQPKNQNERETSS